MRKIKLMLLSLLTLGVYSCSNVSESDLIDSANDPMDPNALVTYDDTIVPIIQSACLGCHTDPPVNGAPIPLINFNQVDQRAGMILNRMSLQSGAPGAMPPSGRLPQATIDLVDQWITDGKLEN